MSNKNQLSGDSDVRNVTRARTDGVCAYQSIRGFSLIEMLVVLLIIVVLISILLPACQAKVKMSAT
jgi:prepilin-type N-terminal cleavage/methylation domain-containing protein